ncbi:MAG: ATP-binding protein [Bacteroidales bacterium]|nr:ATP-binding protein [Bacteroidales bacterium]
MSKIQRLLLLLVVVCPIWMVGQAANMGGRPFFRNFTAMEYGGHNRNFAVACDKNGQVYVGNFEGLLTYDGVNWKMTHTPGISRVTSLLLSADGILWFGGNNVLGYLTPDGNLIFVINDADPEQQIGEITHIDEESQTISFTTSDGKRFHLDEEQRIVAIGEGVPSSTSPMWNNIAVNAETDIPDLGLKALATSTHGVVLIDRNGKKHTSLTELDGLCSNNIIDLAYDGKGCLWGVTNNGLFAVYVSPVISQYSENSGLKGQVTSIMATDSYFLTGTLQGVFTLNADDRFVKLEGINTACWQLCHTTGHGTLLATAEGLFSYRNGLHRITSRHTLSVHAQGDSIFAGELDGIYLYDWTGHGKLVAPIPNVVKYTTEADGTLWAINLYNETYCFDPKETSFNKKDNPAISLLFEYVDEKGNVWSSLSNNQGLTCSTLTRRLQKWCRMFDPLSVQAMQVKSDVAWIGGNFGLLRFDLHNADTMPMYGTQIHIRNFLCDNSSISFQMSNDRYDPIGATQYSYRLHTNGKWTQWSSSQDVNLSHLTFGKYELQVRSLDVFGIINESDVQQFSVPTPIYLKWFAILTYLLLFALAIYLLFRWQQHRNELERIRLESLVKKRTKELEDTQKQLSRKEREAAIGKLTKGLIDRILNPMNYINNFSHLSIGLTSELRENLEEEGVQMPDDIREDSTDALDMLNMNLEKIEEHGISTTRILKAMEEMLKERNDKVEVEDIGPLCKKNIEKCNTYYAKEIKEHNIQVETCGLDSEYLARVNAASLSQVIQSLLQNSFYAIIKKRQSHPTGWTPVVRIALSRPADNDSIVQLSVYDNGTGIESSIIDKVFDPFFTTKPTREAPGVGLYLCQQTLQDWGGSIEVNSVKSEYTKFIIKLH